MVIVDKKEFVKKNELDLAHLRKNTLDKQTCSVSEVIACKWFKGCANTIKKWKEQGKLLDHEYRKVKGKWQIETSAIIRLLDDEKKKTRR